MGYVNREGSGADTLFGDVLDGDSKQAQVSQSERG